MRRLPLLAALAAALLVATAAPASPASGAEVGWVVERVRFVPLDAAHPLTAAGVGTYRGVVEVGPSPATGGVAVINELGVEDYLRGLSEVPNRWPLEALKAQAIAARSYLLSQLDNRVATPTRAAGAQICATDACQVYKGLAKERSEGGERWVAAVEQTAHQVLIHGGRPIVAKYSSSNGGRTVSGGRPYLPGGVPDPFDAASPHHRWRVVIPLPQVQGALGLPPEPPLANVWRAGGEVRWQAVAPDGTVTEGAISAVQFRKALLAAVPPQNGLPQTVPSMRFTATTDSAAGAVVIDGGGWGHGIGMSQWGAYGRARQGWAAPDILAAYYAGLRPVALTPEQVPASVRVAVALGSSQARVTSPGAFRVTDGAGNVLAHAASGVWEVVPARGGVRVVPPPGQGAPLQLAHVVEGTKRPDGDVALRFRVSTPAVVRITYAPPGSQPSQLDLGLVIGERVVPLAVPTTTGDYRILVEADAGGGRVATLVGDFAVSDLRPPPDLAGLQLAGSARDPAAVPDDADRTLTTGLAAAALALTGAGTLRITRRRAG